MKEKQNKYSKYSLRSSKNLRKEKDPIVWRNWLQCFYLGSNDRGFFVKKHLSDVLKCLDISLSLYTVQKAMTELRIKETMSEEKFCILYQNLNPFPMQNMLYEKYAIKWKSEVIRAMEEQNKRRMAFSTKKKTNKLQLKSVVARLFQRTSQYFHVLWNTSYMDQEELETLLEDEYMTDCPSAKEIIKEKSKSANRDGTLSFEGLVSLILSETCDILKTDMKDFYMDMTRPLNHYFVNSTHNTYLEGNQMTSDCSTQAYKNALNMGGRLVELDVYPGSSGSEPIIKHLNFPTKPVPLRKVCESLKKHAFEYSEYPLILSIEDHVEQDDKAKKKMNKIFMEVFAEKLLTTDKIITGDLLPSPKDLKGYIIIKNKKYRNEVFINVCRGVAAKNLGEVFCPGKKHPQKAQPHIFTSLSKPKFYELASSKALELTGFCQDTTERVDAETYGKTSCEALVEWTKHGQIKVYPANFQVLSGHFDPRDPWFCGVQYSCLNFQNMDMNTIINYGMFNRNGNCGYLLKPDFLRPGCGLFFNPLKLTLTSKTTGEKEKLPKDKVRIQILAAMQLPRIEKRFVKYDPYVRVFVLDRFGKSNCNSYKTLVVSNNAFNPAWNNLISFEIVASELALILFQVLDSNIKKDDVIASNCIPYTCMRTGHVHIPLYDESLKLLPNSCLFSKIQISSKGTGRRPSFKQEESELG